MIGVAAGRKALVVATYRYTDGGLRQLAAAQHDAEAFAAAAPAEEPRSLPPTSTSPGFPG